MTTKNIPQLRENDEGATQLIVGGKPLLMLAGELHNSSSSSLAYMDRVWSRLTALNLNTVLAPVSWELVEPVEGKFDFTLVDGLIEGCRRNGLKLIPLWFGTWKNTHSSYAPAWVKTDLARFPRAETKPGLKSTTISALANAARDADAKAFAALMRHIKKVDADEQTVIMVQVENEVGLLGAPRDYSAASDAVFNGPTAPGLIGYMREHRDDLHPFLAAAWESGGGRSYGTWSEVFDKAAEEVYTAWHTAQFVGKVVKAGIAEYTLPMFVNAWLVQHEHEPPGGYPSGGPVTKVIDVWRAAAPQIALLAPDIYVSEFADVCAEYHRPGNTLLIPEARRDLTVAAHSFYAIGEHDAIAFAPFGIDSIGIAGEEHVIAGAAADASFTVATDTDGTLLAQAYRLLGDMAPVINSYQGTGQMCGVLQTGDDPIEMPLEKYNLTVTFNRPLFEPLPESEANVADSVDEDVEEDDAEEDDDDDSGKVHAAWTTAAPTVQRTRIPGRPPAGGLIISVDADTFIVAGFGFSVRFAALEGDDRQADYLELWEGDYRAGEWSPLRRLNGDEYALRLPEEPSVRHAKLFLF